jgi:hypothetical protein
MKKFFVLIAATALAQDLHISADSMRGNLSFLSSDLLEGRNTPSRGLDIAAEFIAGQFRRIGLEPIGDDQYFQTAFVTVREQNPQGFEMTITGGGKTIHVDASHVQFLSGKIQIDNVPVAITPEDPAGKVVIVTAPGKVNTKDAALVLYHIPAALRPMVFDSEVAPRQPARNIFSSAEALDFIKNNPDAKITIHSDPPIEHRAKVRNVAGLLRGSDPQLRDTYVLLTAHYDHVGTRPDGDDKIFNGANDDGSGTVSVIEIASAIAHMNPRPKRSIVFMTFFGEELGMVGSRYYARHPLEPLSKTIAHFNLEQLGRTDDTEGPQVREATITGYDFSNMPQMLSEAAKQAGVNIHDRPHTAEYFMASDNLALAEKGVPAHTLGVTFEFPDYHQVGDEWQKIDYDNMVKIDEAIGYGLLRLASDAEPPKWNPESSAAKRFAEAAKKLQ